MRYAIVSGGAHGIGRAICEKLLSEGFSIATCGRNREDLAAIEAEWNERWPEASILALQADLSIKEEARSFGSAVLANFPQVDILVNNAGIFVPGAIHQEEEGLLEKLMAVNVYSAYHLTRALLPMMTARRKGHIFNMCSTASHKSYPNGGSYSITKHALLGFSKNLREELKNLQIKVTALSPGPTLTASWEGFDGPPARLMPPEDIASVIWSAYQLAPQTVVEDILLRPMLGDL